MNSNQASGPVLVAVDGRDYREEVVTQAIASAARRGGGMVAVSVVDLYPSAMELAVDLGEALSTEAREALEQVQSASESAGVPCTALPHTGRDAGEVIIEEANKQGVSLIVMGTHQRSDFERFFRGSVAEKVIAHSPCPVLVVPLAKR